MGVSWMRPMKYFAMFFYRKDGWLVPEDEAFIYRTYRIPEALYRETYFVCEGANISSGKIA